MAKSKAQSIIKQIEILEKKIAKAEENGDYTTVEVLTAKLMLLYELV